VAARVPRSAMVVALHFGGGSPTMLKPDDLRRLTDWLRAAFVFADDVAISVEIDPNDMDDGRLDALADIGTTRASLGVQDFDPVVQKAINRMQSFEVTRRVVDGLRARGVGAVNLDMVYGLPHQTVAGIEATTRQCLTLDPDRLAIFGYAHVPWFKKHQTMIDEATLPDHAARLAQSQAAASAIAAAGYIPIGLDHFARPGDTLAEAAAEGRLRRNFQGYTEDPCETLIGFGPSSIARYREGHAQNTPAMGEYARAIREGRLPVARGIAFSEDDRLRGWVIEKLMCEFGFCAREARTRFGARVGPVLAEAETLARNAARPLLVRKGDRFEVPLEMRTLVRVAAAGFDPYFAAGKARHSVAV
jgi:oxygen-independent coproporphyrinogen-3 oxidase